MPAKDISKDPMYCEVCHRSLRRDDFYVSNNLEKYPNHGTLTKCKKCLTMHVNNWDPKTYIWILQEIDVPYVPEEWDKLLIKYGKDPSKMTGTTILGRYISKMRLRQFKDYRYKDTEFLREVLNKQLRESMEAQGKDIQEITKVLQESTSRIEIPVEEPDYSIAPTDPAIILAPAPQPFVPQGVPAPVETESNVEELGLTEDDVRYLRLRWGRAYKPEEWIWLERFYRNFEQTYDIQTAGHKDTLMKLAKVSLKLDQLIDLGDIEGAQKTERMYDNLMKSGSFTAHQNKEDAQMGIDSIGEIVSLCESQGFIPRYYTDGPKDKVDRVLQDLQEYTRSLILEETNIGDLIDNAVRQIEIEKQKEAESETSDLEDDEALEESLFSEDKTYLTDNAFTEFSGFEEELEEANEEIYKQGSEEK